MRYLIILSILSIPCTPLAAPCTYQDYELRVTPDFDCPGPGEMGLIPEGMTAPSIGVPKGSKLVLRGKPAMTLGHSGLLMDKERAVYLGLRITHLRKLRFHDYQRFNELTQSKITFQERLCDNKYSACKNFLTDCKAARKAGLKKMGQVEKDLERARAWYRSPFLWFSMGMIIASGGIFGGALLL